MSRHGGLPLRLLCVLLVHLLVAHPALASVLKEKLKFDNAKIKSARESYAVFRSQSPAACQTPQVLEAVSSDINMWSVTGTYQNNQNCEWQILAPADRIVLITFLNFDLEDSSPCIYDYVELQDFSVMSQLLASYKYCGSVLPPAFASSGNQVLVKFHSDGSVVRRGFSLHYTSHPQGNGTSNITSVTVYPPTSSTSDVVTTQEETNHSFGTSPDLCSRQQLLEDTSGDISIWPGELHSTSLNCTWVILVPEDSIVTIFWSEVDLVSSLSCDYNYVQLNDFSTSGHLLASNNILLIQSRYVINLLYSELSSATSAAMSTHLPTPQLNSVTTATTATVMYFTEPPVTISSCSGTHVLEGAPGSITMWAVNGSYLNNQHCVWYILAPQDNIVLITFHTFELENENCSYDYVQLHDFSSSGELLGSYMFCGWTLPQAFTSSGSQVVITFHSDETVTMRGFSLFYSFAPSNSSTNVTSTTPNWFLPSTLLSCNVIQEVWASRGSISVGSASEHYQSHQDCEWRLITTPGMVIRIAWHNFDLENSMLCDYDYLEVLDYSEVSTKFIGKYCGGSLPPPLITASNVAVIRFHSDGSRSGHGFTILYDSIPSGY
nr:dorsal-ventral patterning tolloid-like protein 1 [Cherax quadricarinatus]